MTLDRPTSHPLPIRLLLLFFVILTAVLAIATGYYHQRWQNQVKRTARLQKQLDVLTATASPTLKIDSAQTTK